MSNAQDRLYDVVTLGETMIRLTPKGYTRLEEAAELECRIGGSESNVVVALAVEVAREARTTVSFDINYRAKLWSPAEARAALEPLLARANLVIGTDTDVRLLFEISGPPQEMASALRDRLRAEAVALTL